MKTTYLGLELRSPVIVASSPYTADAEHVARCIRHGAGAVVIKSIFEEEIVRHAAALSCASPDAGMGDAGEYLERYLGDEYLARHLQLIAAAREAGKTTQKAAETAESGKACEPDVPVIASINCIAGSDGWADYAVAMERAGASALEVNIFLQPTDRHLTATELERTYADTVCKVAEATAIPIAVKLPQRLTNVLAVADALVGRGARGAVLFNRFFEPDIDIEQLTFTVGSPYSHPSELRNVLRNVALCATAVPQLDIAVSTGVHDGKAAVKALLCGARAVQICTAIHQFGYPVIGEMNAFIDAWADRHGFASLEEFRGRMDYGHAANDVYQRTQYMKYYRELCEAAPMS